MKRALLVYGSLHGLVDLICVGMVYSVMRFQLTDQGYYFSLLVLYNFLAFAIQPVLGLLIDKLRAPRSALLVGLGLLAAALLIFPNSLLLCVLLLGIGNALFHLGAGTISLNLTPGRATAPGIFVAPGALGLLLGALVGRSSGITPYIFLTLLAGGAVAVLFLKQVKIDYQEKPVDPLRKNVWLLALLLVFVAIMFRSLVGLVVNFPWKSQMELLVVLTLAIASGKALGGWLADRFGWIRVAVGALVLSMPLLAFAAAIPALAIPGIFLFNFTMPVTLVALARLLPGRPGFAFGLTCLALFLGFIPLLLGLSAQFSTSLSILVLILFAIAVLYAGLRNLKRLKLLST